MSRKPIQLELAGKRTPRERMWAAMRKLGTFAPTQIEDAAHPITLESVLDYVAALAKAGFVRQIKAQSREGAARFTHTQYVVERPVVAQAPRVDAEGRESRAPLGVIAMWRAMKVRRSFDAAQLAADATQGDITCTVGTAKSYLAQLKRAGYLAVERESVPGRLARYRLIRDTGPLPPAVTRAKVVFDRNTGELMPVQTAQEVADALDH
jgi:hypothetical protein